MKKPKYQVNDKVFVIVCNEIQKCKIVSVKLDGGTFKYSYKIRFSIFTWGPTEERYIFPTKEELIKTL